MHAGITLHPAPSQCWLPETPHGQSADLVENNRHSGIRLCAPDLQASLIHYKSVLVTEADSAVPCGPGEVFLNKNESSSCYLLCLAYEGGIYQYSYFTNEQVEA